MIINKIIAVEGLDKTGKSSFCDSFEMVWNQIQGTNGKKLNRFSFPNPSTPIGAIIRNELNSSNPDSSIVNTPNFLSEMSHYWMNELFLNTKLINDNNSNNYQIVNTNIINESNYLFDRYFISTLAYQAFYNNSRTDLEFIKVALNTNKFIKMPTDIIFLDLPNDLIIERTESDIKNGLVDSNDTLDIEILNKRRDAYFKSLEFLKGSGVNIHWFEDVSLYKPEDLSRVLLGKIF